MPLVFSAALTAALERASMEAVVLMTITTHSGATAETRKFTNLAGYHAGLRYTPAVQEVTPVGFEIDPIERTGQVAQCSITMLDTGPSGDIRRLIEQRRIKGKLVTIRWGCEDDAEADLQYYWSGVVDDHECEEASGVITLKCSSEPLVVEGRKFKLYTTSYHPAEVLYQALTQGGVAAAILDAITIAFDADLTKSHWVVRHREQLIEGQPSTHYVPDSNAQCRFYTVTVTGDVTGAVLSLYTNGSLAATLTEGSDWSKGGSYSEAAANLTIAIEEAIADHESFASGAVVYVASLDHYKSVTATSSDAQLVVALYPTTSLYANWELDGVNRRSCDLFNLYPALEYDTGDAAYYVRLYKDSAGATLVAQSQALSMTGSGGTWARNSTRTLASLAEVDDSGISGTVLVQANQALHDPHASTYVHIYYSSLVELDCQQTVNDMCALMQASLVPCEDGVLRLRYYSTDAAAETIPEHESWDFKVEEMTGTIYNRGTASLRYRYAEHDRTLLTVLSASYTEEREFDLVIDDSTSQTDHSVDGGTTPAVFNYDMPAVDWVCGCGPITFDVDNSASAIRLDESASLQLRAYHATNWGCCGMGGLGSGTPPSQDSDRTLSSSRPAYFRLDGEIIKSTSSAPNNRGDMLYVWNGSTQVAVRDWEDVEYGSLTRAQLSTTQADHPAETIACDVTIPVWHLQTVVNRCKNGLQVISFNAHRKWSKLQVGDHIGVVLPSFIAYGLDGLTEADSVTWEVIGNTLDLTANPPGLRLKVARV